MNNSSPQYETPEVDTKSPISYKAEVKRKAIHLVALIIPLGMVLLEKPLAIYILTPLAVIAFAADYLRVKSPWFSRIIGVVFGSLMRKSELPPVGGSFVINGATWVLLSASLLIFAFPVGIAVPAFTLFMLGDAAAALVGRRWGRHPWLGSSRTIEGSLAFFAVGLGTVALFSSSIPLWIGALSALVGALVEAFPGPINDNLAVPVAVASVIAFCDWFFLGGTVSLFSLS